MNAFFSPDYAAARERFLACARRERARIESHAHPLRGPGGEALAVDVAWLGGEQARHVLVLFSGTHGVEGYVGSAVQSATLTAWPSTPAHPDVAVMLVHAVNPHGFAWDRRVDHEGIDLARNFIDFTPPLPECPEFDAALAQALTPADWDGPGKQRADEQLAGFFQSLGADGLRAVIPRGQHEHPAAPFYAGRAPAWSNRLMRQTLRERLAHAAEVFAIDYHCGLGPCGVGQLVPPRHLTRGEAERAREAWEPAWVAHGDQQSVALAFEGSLVDVMAHELPQVRLTRASFEFGTCSPIEVLEALRRDHGWHAHAARASVGDAAVRAHMRSAFCIDDDAWQHAVLRQGLWAQARAMEALHRSARAS